MTLVAAQGNDNTANQTSTILTHTDAINIINAILSGAVGSIAGIFITPFLRERYKKRQAYFKPYIKWCVSFAGILHEFEEICRVVRPDSPKTCAKHPKKIYTDIDIITHVWQMHHSIEEGYKWLVLVKTDNSVVGEYLDEIMDAVDRLWHNLEINQYQYLLRKDDTNKDFKKILQSMAYPSLTLLKTVRDYIDTEIQKDAALNYVGFEKVECFLYKKAPRRWWKIIPPSCSTLFKLCNECEKLNQH